MHGMRLAEAEDFPKYGARARVWTRFERDLAAWLATPEGRFAVWRAEQGRCTTAESASPDRPGTS